MTFKELHLVEPILKALEHEGYTAPTPIQEQSIPILLRNKDLLGCAQTGTGKTAAFAIPILQQIFLNIDRHKKGRKIKALIVTPTRELAIQIADSFNAYGRFTGINNCVIFGGVKQGNQVKALQRGVDVLVATPGRLLDLIGQGYISLKHIEYFVLDEADRMLDMGFIHDIKKLLKMLPDNRQSLFFSATMSDSIVKLSQKILGDPEKVSVKPEQTTAERVNQSIYFVSKKSKPALLIHLLEKLDSDSTLIFSRTKHGANKIVKFLSKSGHKAEAIHGNKSQTARQLALGNFKDGKIKILVATDIAARGIDVSELMLVINYDLPNVAETYVHRIGRTGRAQSSGSAISFCDSEERAYLKDIQKLIKQTLPVENDHPFAGEIPETAGKVESENKPGKKPQNNSGKNKRHNRNYWKKSKSSKKNKSDRSDS